MGVQHYDPKNMSEDENKTIERLQVTMSAGFVFRFLEAINEADWARLLSIKDTSLAYATLASEHWQEIMVALRKEMLPQLNPGGSNIPFTKKGSSNNVDFQAVYAVYSLLRGIFTLGMTVQKNLDSQDLFIVHQFLRYIISIIEPMMRTSPLDEKSKILFLNEAIFDYCTILYHHTNSIQSFLSMSNSTVPQKVLNLPYADGRLVMDIQAYRKAIKESKCPDQILIFCDMALALSGISSEHYTTPHVKQQHGLRQANTPAARAQKAKEYLNKQDVFFNAKGRSPSNCCSNCGKFESRAETLRYCGGCNLLRYCGSTCAKEHWKKGHKTRCNKMTMKK